MITVKLLQFYIRDNGPYNAFKPRSLDQGEPQDHLIAQCSNVYMVQYQRDSQLLQPMDLTDTWEEVS